MGCVSRVTLEVTCVFTVTGVCAFCIYPCVPAVSVPQYPVDWREV